MSLMRRRDRASRLDLKEEERNYLVTADIPAGFSMSDIRIEIRGGTLTISSKIKKVKATIAKDLGLKGKARYLSTLDTSSIPNYSSYSEKMREAVLVGRSELE